MDKENAVKISDSRRIGYIDKVKGISMICIIAGHMGSAVVNSIVFTFHVPVFFIISGIFYKAEAGKIWGSVKRLLKAYVFTVLFVMTLDIVKHTVRMVSAGKPEIKSIGTLILDYLSAGVYGSGSKSDFLGIQVRSIGAIWFYLGLIWAMFMCFAAIQISRHISRNEKTQIIMMMALAVGLWFLGYLSADAIWLPLSVQSGLCAAIFLLIGYCGRNFLLGKINIWIFVLSVSLWFVSLYFSVSGKHMSMVKNSFPDPVINVMGAIGAAYFLITVFKKFSCHIIGKGLEIFGKYSMVVLSFHYIEKNMLDWDKIAIRLGGAPAGYILCFIIKLTWCSLGILAVKKSRVLRWVYSVKE